MFLSGFTTRFLDWMFRRPGPVARYLMPFVTVGWALGLQIAVSLFVPKKIDFPYAFFYLFAILAAAWFGGYIPGILSVVVAMVVLPLIALPNFHLSNIDPSRLLLSLGLSVLISLVAQSQRRMREVLSRSNTDLGERVQLATAELDKVVADLRIEVAHHKHTEEQLRQAEERVDLALDAAGIGRWDVNLATGKVERSPRHDQIFGFHEGDTASHPLFERVIPEDFEAVNQSFQNAVETGGVCEFECRIRHPERGVRWIWAKGKAIVDETGKTRSFLGSSRDVTDRRSAEEKLKTQFERLNLLGRITRSIAERQDLRSIFQVVVRSLEDGLPVDFGCVCLCDAQAEEVVVTCVGVNSETLAMDLAMTEQAHIKVDQNGLSKCVRGQLVYEKDVTQVDFPFPQRLARSGLRALVAAPLLFESRVFGALIAARREPDSFSSGDCEFLRQLSEHVALAAHQAETHNALQQAYDDLRQTQQSVMQQERLRALGQMASGIAHDINNAISPIALYTEILLDQETSLSTRAREYLETTQRAIGDVAHTVSRMREFYRQQEPELVLSPVNLATLVQQVADLTRARWCDIPQQRGVVIDMRLDKGENLAPVGGIESEIREALINLVFNGVDAMPEGGTLTVRTLAAGPDHVDVEVTDTGVGMSEDTRRRCLEPFFTTKGERGTGLGLAMVYGVARRHNADIQIESAIGQGTTMRLRFPVFAAAEVATPADLPDAAPPRLRILSVDDDPLLIKSLRDALEGDGHDVITANGGQDGIDAFRKAEKSDRPFELVITDLGMPYVDGRKVASAIKAGSPSTPVILLTGWGQRLVAEGDIPPNVDRVLNKPPRLRDLRAALADLAGRSVTTSVVAHQEDNVATEQAS